MTQSSVDLVLLRSASIEATFDQRDGSLVRLATTDGRWTILDAGDATEPVHGLGFAVRVPLPDRRNNVADSRDQDPPTWELADDGTSARAIWTSLRSAYGGVHDIGVTLTVTAIDERLVFTMHLDNRSELIVEDVRFPWLSEVRPPDPSRQLHSFSYRYAAGRRRPIWPTFPNVPGYYGVDHPTFLNEGEGTVGAPVAPFILLEDGSDGLYVGVDRPSPELVGWHAELHPGWADSMLQSVPTDAAGLPEPIAIRFTAAHLPYLAPGESRTLTPVALAAYRGDWHTGADVYRARRSTWIATAIAPAWAAEPISWLQLHVNSPEDELRLPFDRLPEIARSCAKLGVGVIQLVGWNRGGQDRDNPSHDADLRLGGPDKLRSAIAECQALGVRVVLFAKFTWADRSSERFRTELVRDAVTDPYGDYYMHPGYRYQTISQLFDVSTRRLVPMCFESPHYQQVCDEDHRSLLDLGADGMLFDESLHHSPALLCFDTRHGHRAGHPVYARDRDLIHRFAAASRDRNPEFLYAGEACYDWEFDAYQLSYHRSEDPGHIPLSRYLQPDVQLMTAVTGFDDRNMVGQALLYRYLLSYEPYNFKGRLEDFPATTSYGWAMDALRLRYREWFWDGEFVDTVGARVTNGDKNHHPFSVFRLRDGGHPGAAVANYDEAVEATVRVLFDSHDEALAYHLVGGDGWTPADPDILLPARSAAIVLPSAAVGLT